MCYLSIVHITWACPVELVEPAVAFNLYDANHPISTTYVLDLVLYELTVKVKP